MFSYLPCMKAESSQSIVTAIKEYKYNGIVRHIKTASFHLFMYCLFICHTQIDSNTPFKQMKEMSVSVSILSF